MVMRIDKTFYVEDLYPEIREDEITFSYLRSIYNSIHSLQFNFLGVSTGKHRVGKSITSVFFSTLLDKTFLPNFEKRVVYYPDQFMNALKDIEKKKIIGGAIVWDECNVGLPAREWYDISNKSINFALQVMGYLRPIIFFVTQDMTFIDSQARKLFHAFFEITRPSASYNFVKPFNVEYDKKRGKIFFIYPRIVRMIEGIPTSNIKLKGIKLEKPPGELISLYEYHSEPFKERIMRQMKERVEKFKEGVISKKQYTTSEIINEVIENYKKFETRRSTMGNVLLDYNLIRYEYSIPVQLAKYVKSFCERKINEMQREELGMDS